jgi:hypothetical protein
MSKKDWVAFSVETERLADQERQRMEAEQAKFRAIADRVDAEKARQ